MTSTFVGLVPMLWAADTGSGDGVRPQGAFATFDSAGERNRLPIPAPTYAGAGDAGPQARRATNKHHPSGFLERAAG